MVAKGYAKIIGKTMNQQKITSPIGDYSYYATSYPQPTANITVRRNRVKQYGSNIYLKDGTNFEIELWNPKSNRVLAKITINGETVSDVGIVVNPGQRVYLERFLNVDRKFKFVTYAAENTSEGRRAIQNNGDVKVEFYDEAFYTYKSSKYTVCGEPWWQYYHNGTGGSPVYRDHITNSVNFNSTLPGGVDFNTSDPIGAASFNSANIFMSQSDMPKSIETGRVEKGEKSNQCFNETNGDFSPFPCAIYTFKILPESQQPQEATEIRSYCTQCGRRWRQGENFCPQCGTPNNK